MTSHGKPGKWQRAMVVATGIGVLGASLGAPLAEASVTAPVAKQSMLRLQEDADAQPTQVDEGENDSETLDQGSPSAASGEDVETLDQGPPPADTAAVTVPVPVADGAVLAPASAADGAVLPAAPVATDSAYSAPAGPWLPPGFGEGRVLVSNSSRGFPVGLEPCEVGVVTGRAYVGVKCGEDGRPVVGHSTYEDFPWVIDPGFPFEPGAAVVTDPSFPFDEDSPFFESTLDRTTGSDVVVLVAPRSFPFNDEDGEADEDAVSSDAPEVSSRGVVSLAQETKAGKEQRRDQTRVTSSASSGDASSDGGKSNTRRSAANQQRATVGSESKRGKNAGGKQGNKAKANKKKDRKGAGKESKKQRAQGEKRDQRNKDR